MNGLRTTFAGLFGQTPLLGRGKSVGDPGLAEHARRDEISCLALLVLGYRVQMHFAHRKPEVVLKFRVVRAHDVQADLQFLEG